jgi:DNA polymerase-3 subunit epsilon
MENGNLLTALPIKNGRYIILDTETTGVNPDENNIIELACIEISKGKLTGSQFHCYLRPRHKIDHKAMSKHKLHPTFYDDYFSDVYQSDKACLENFLKFIGNSIVFAHNATFDIGFINNELRYWKLPIIPKGRFRCTMRLFKNIFGTIDHRLKKYCSLAKCCEFFNLKAGKENFHSAVFDAFMTARLVCRYYEFIESYNVNPTNLSNLNLALFNAEKIITVNNIGVVKDKCVKEVTYRVEVKEELIHVDPDDIMNILEQHGDFIENYMKDDDYHEEIVVDINMTEPDEGSCVVKAEDVLLFSNDELADIENVIKYNS